jgi:hypothetical protein
MEDERRTESADPARLSGQQKSLFEELAKQNPILSRMYLGSVVVLRDLANPDRFPQCAHSIRELMEKLPTWFDVPTKAHRESLGNQVSNLVSSFEAMKSKSTCHNEENGWEGEIDGRLKGFIERFEVFVTWKRNHFPRRREEAGDLLERIDASGRRLPQPLAEKNADIWMELKDYFTVSSHHPSNEIDEEEFLQWVDAFEKIILDRLVPRTFDDFKEIDGLIEEGELDA